MKYLQNLPLEKSVIAFFLIVLVILILLTFIL